MAIIAMGQGRAMKQSKLHDENRRGSWIFVIFFFFWTATNSVLLPWLPMVLRTTGMSFGACGGVISITVITSIISVRLGQVILISTKKGHMRRLFLLTAIILSVILQVIPISLLPNAENKAICSPSDKTYMNYVSQIIPFNQKNESLFMNETTLEKLPPTSISHSTTAPNNTISEKATIEKHSSKIVIKSTTTTTNAAIATKPNTTTTIDKLNTTLSSHLNITNNNFSHNNTSLTNKLISTTKGTVSLAKATNLNIYPNLTTANELPTHPTTTKHTSFSSIQDNSPSFANVPVLNNNKSKAEKQSTSSSKSYSYNYDYQNYYDENDYDYKDDERLTRFNNPKYRSTSQSKLFKKIMDYLFRTSGKKEINELKYVSNLDDMKNILDTKLKSDAINFHESKLINNYINKILENKEKSNVNRFKIQKKNFHKPGREHHHKVNHKRFRRSMENKPLPDTAKVIIINNSTVNLNYLPLSNAHWTVSVLFIFGILFGSGIEACISKLWHCISHGYQHIESLQDDILERTISSTFHLITYGRHKNWSSITSACWVAMASISVGLACAIGIGVEWPYTIMASAQILTAIFTVFCLLILPIPSGTLEPPQTKRPLSLYLDDEVLREGIRRISFHLWVFCMALVTALPNVYKVWLLNELRGDSSEFASQVFAVILQLIGEGLTVPAHKRFSKKFGILGMMGISAIIVGFQSGICWITRNPWIVAASYVLIGMGEAILWIAVKNNALLLATIRDQEREAGMSWTGHRLGTAVGTGMWGAIIGSGALGGHMHPLLICTAALGGLMASVVASAALITKSERKTRRRIYHTLDLYNNSVDDDDDDDSAEEDDWLVKRAKREGIDI